MIFNLLISIKNQQDLRHEGYFLDGDQIRSL